MLIRHVLKEENHTSENENLRHKMQRYKYCGRQVYSNDKLIYCDVGRLCSNVVNVYE